MPKPEVRTPEGRGKAEEEAEEHGPLLGAEARPRVEAQLNLGLAGGDRHEVALLLAAVGEEEIEVGTGALRREDAGHARGEDLLAGEEGARTV